ncbi:MAG: hypothetical protein IPK17_21680 [Chloroflexi bacterium]|uniref:hypothetical protein n=1 Tax=Candidatus Flexifilum breve TaxID=3140694 RepID=UPI0031358314|nr:hypothetical protein [Chloroflexota bacterium]
MKQNLSALGAERSTARAALLAQMKRVNKRGAPLVSSLPRPERVDRFLLNDVVRSNARW